jgi:hypothetical protein
VAQPQLMQDDAGNVWDMSSGKPVFVHGAQSGGPQTIIPAPAAKPEFVPGNPNKVYHPDTGVVSNVPGVAAPPPPAPNFVPGKPGYVVTGTPDAPRAVPIAGLPASQDDALAKKQTALEATRNLVQSIEKARKLVDGYSTGVGGAILHHVPATEAAQLDTIINQEIRGNIFKNWVDTMKAQSDTGGTGIGRIMQSEIPLVTGSLGALDPVKMGKQGTLDSLDQIEQRVLRSAAMVNGENPDDKNVVQKYRTQFLGAPSDAAVQAELKARIAHGEDPADTIQWLTAVGRPPNKQTIAEILANKGNQNPDVRPPNGGGYPNSYVGQGLSGANEGLASVLGAPIDMGDSAVNLFDKGVNALAGTNLPTNFGNAPLGGEWWKRQLSDIGSIQAPTSDPSKQFVRRVGQSVGAAAVPGMFGGSIPKFGAALLSGVGGGIGGATAQQVAPNNPLAEFGGEMVGGGLTGLGLAKAGQMAAQRGIESAVPTVEDLKQQASNLYRQAETRGVTANPDQTQALATGIHGILRDEGQIGPSGAITDAPTNTSKAFNLIQQYAGKEMTPKEMNTVRSVLADSRQSADPSDRRLGSILLDHFDNWASPLAPEFDQARSVASRYLQAQDLERARELAGARASQFTGSGFENALRTEYRGLDRANIKGQNYFAPDVTNAIQTVARGTPVSNTLRGLGRLAPTGPVSGMGSVVPAIGVGAITNPVTGGMFGGGLAGLGIAGRVGATRMGIRAADQAELIARNGGALNQAPLLPDNVKDFAAWLAAVQQPKYLSGN